MKLTQHSVKNSVTVFFAMVAVVILGSLAYVTLPRESSPDISIPLILVSTVYPGASPVDVEQQVTRILERELKGVENLKKLTSTSQESVSIVEVEFVAGTDLDVARQKVRDRVDTAKVDFAEEVEDPAIHEINFSDIPVIQVHLSGPFEPVFLKQLAENLEDTLETITGVLRVTIVGGLEREVHVDVDPSKLWQYGVSLDDVIHAIQKEHVNIPGGDLKLGDLSYAVRLPGEAESPEEIEDFVVKSEQKKAVYVRDVAQVYYGFKDRQSYARIDGEESVSLSIQKRVGANIIEVAEAVKVEVDRAAESWPSALNYTLLADQSKEIGLMVNDLENNILSGVILVVLVLMFALGFRQALFVGIAIPFSMLMTFIVVQAMGVTLNMVVLFSLVLALGMLVDNAVVVVENIYRHNEEGMGRAEAAVSATEEVGGAIFVSTLTTLAAFFPLFFWPGIVGDFMVYLPITVSIALVASLLVAFTFNPVLCARFLRVRTRRRERTIDRMGSRITALYEKVLAWSLEHRARVVGGTVAAFVLVVTAFVVWNTGIEFFSATEPPQILIDVELPPGTRLSKTDEIIRALEEKVSGVSDLEVLAAGSGAGSQSEFGSSSSGDVTKGRIILDLFDRVDRAQDSFLTMEQVREVAGEMAGTVIEVDRPPEGPPVGAPVVIEISGDDFEVLGGLADRIKDLIRDIPGLVSLNDDFERVKPELIVKLDRVEASRLGLSTYKLASTIRTAINGTKAAIYRDGEDEADITVRLNEKSRQHLSELASLTLYNDDGVPIPLSSVATLERGASLTSIRHKDQKRMVTISGKVTSPELAQPVRSEAQRRINAETQLVPAGYRIAFAGQQEEEEEAKAFLSRAFLMGILLVLGMMVGKFNSVRIPLIIITSVLMSMVGVLLGLLATGLPFGIIMTGLGIISLAGIVVNNAIVLLVYAEQLRERGYTRRETVMRAGLRRMRPVLLTAITTLFGLIPLTTGIEFDFKKFHFSTGGESSQWWSSMGVAVMFGLTFATFLTLILVPVLYDYFLQSLEKRQRREAVEVPIEEVKAEAN